MRQGYARQVHAHNILPTEAFVSIDQLNLKRANALHTSFGSSTPLWHTAALDSLQRQRHVNTCLDEVAQIPAQALPLTAQPADLHCHSLPMGTRAPAVTPLAPQSTPAQLLRLAQPRSHASKASQQARWHESAAAQQQPCTGSGQRVAKEQAGAAHADAGITRIGDAADASALPVRPRKRSKTEESLTFSRRDWHSEHRTSAQSCLSLPHHQAPQALQPLVASAAGHHGQPAPSQAGSQWSSSSCSQEASHSASLAGPPRASQSVQATFRDACQPAHEASPFKLLPYCQAATQTAVQLGQASPSPGPYQPRHGSMSQAASQPASWTATRPSQTTSLPSIAHGWQAGSQPTSQSGTSANLQTSSRPIQGLPQDITQQSRPSVSQPPSRHGEQPVVALSVLLTASQRLQAAASTTQVRRLGFRVELHLPLLVHRPQSHDLTIRPFTERLRRSAECGPTARTCKNISKAPAAPFLSVIFAELWSVLAMLQITLRIHTLVPTQGICKRACRPVHHVSTCRQQLLLLVKPTWQCQHHMHNSDELLILGGKHQLACPARAHYIDVGTGCRSNPGTDARRWRS